MIEVPAPDRLAHVMASLARHLPTQLPVLLAASRFADGRAALARLATEGAAAAAVAGVRRAEAARLTDLVLDRWAAVADVVIDPAAVVVGPSEVWVSGGARAVRYDVATIGVEDGWTAEWSNGSPVVELPVPADDEDAVVLVTVRVFCRIDGRRDVLVAQRPVRARRPVARLDPAGRRVFVADHRGRAASDTDLTVDGATHRTDRHGAVQLDQPAGPSLVVLVDGQVTAWAP